jgi:hypothetical protein
LTQIPDLGTVPDNEAQIRLGSRTTTSNRSPQQQPLPEPVDLSQVNTRDNRFIWAAIIVIGFTLAGLAWWNF